MSDEERRARRRERERARRAENPEPMREAVRRWRAANHEQANASALASYHKYARKNYLDLLYGLSEERFAQLLAEQGYCCYLCREPLDLDNSRNIHVDHDHSCCRGERTCGKCVLGIACRDCNIGCGYFGDDPDRMERVAAARRAAMAEAALRIAGKPVQGELPLNVTRIDRKQESA
jgi:Recombination endonuclease VII